MRILSLVIVLITIVTSCSTTTYPIYPTTPVDTKVILAGKWKETNMNVKVYFEEELNKIVLSNGCQVVSANYNRFEPAISFSNITSTQKTCEVQGMDLDQILKETILIKNRSNKQIVFLNENQEELLILNKN